MLAPAAKRPNARREMLVIGPEYPVAQTTTLGGFAAAARGNCQFNVVAAIAAVIGFVMTFRDYSF
jgi:hypothetical protein